MNYVEPILEIPVDQNSKIINLWPTAIWKTNINRSHSFIENQYSNLENHKLAQLSDHNLRSADTDIINKKPLENIKEFVINELQRYVKTVINPVSDIETFFTQSWMTFTKEYQNHHPHYHSNSFLTAVYYLVAEDGVDAINIMNNSYTFNNRHPIYIDNTPTWWISRMISVPVKTGDLVIFPSYMDHGVSAVKKISHYRVSISMNTWFRGEIGREENLNRVTFK